MVFSPSSRRFTSRRRGGRSPVVGGGAADLTDTAAYVLTGFQSTAGNQVAYTSDEDAASITTISTPRIVLVAMRMTATVTAFRTLLSCSGGAAGWDFLLDSSHRPIFRLYDGGGVLRTRTGNALSAGTDIHVLVATYAGVGGSGTIRTRKDKDAFLASAPFTGMTAPSAGRKLVSGGPTSPATSVDILGWACGDTIPTDGEIDAWIDEIASQQFVTAAPVGTSVAYNAKRTMSDLCARGEWDPTHGTGVTMLRNTGTTITATPLVAKIDSPTWAYAFTPGTAYTKSGDSVAADGKVCIDTRGTAGSNSPFQDNQHFAFSGDRCADFLAGGSNDLALLFAAGIGADCDVLQIMLGTNGMGSDVDRAQEQTDYAALLAYAYTLRPTARVIVTTIIPHTDPTTNARIVTFNAALPAIWDVSSYHTDGLLVRLDMYTDAGLNTGTDYADTVHLNDTGNAKVAPVFESGLSAAIAISPALRGRVIYCPVGDSITVGVGSTDGAGFRRILADTYYPGPWQS